MGRAQGFDTDTVVRAARRVFWEHGYERTGIADLEAATGLRRSSLYHAFGNKSGLFDAVIDSYLTEVIRPRLRPLQVDDVAPTALVDYLTGLRAAMAEQSAIASYGCLLVSAASAPVVEDDTVRAAIVAYHRELSTAFRRGLLAADPDAAGETVDRSVRTITSLVIAAFGLTRADHAAALANLDTALVVARTPVGVALSGA